MTTLGWLQVGGLCRSLRCVVCVGLKPVFFCEVLNLRLQAVVAHAVCKADVSCTHRDEAGICAARLLMEVSEGDDATHARARFLLLGWPGFAAGVALASRSMHGDYERLLRKLLLSEHAPSRDLEVASWLVDPLFTVCALVGAPPPALGAGRLALVVRHVAASPLGSRALADAPFSGSALPAAATLATLAALDDRFVRTLAAGSHLDTLVASVAAHQADAGQRATLRAGITTPPAPSAPPRPNDRRGCGAHWYRQAVTGAFHAAAAACGISPAAAPRPREAPAARLTPGDVGVPRRDSTVFLITVAQPAVAQPQKRGRGALTPALPVPLPPPPPPPLAPSAASLTRPFHACGLLLEAASPVLREALSHDARAPIVLSLSIDAPLAEHHRLFSLFAEHAYCGSIAPQRLPPADLLPLWTLAHFLQDDVLKAWLLDTRMREAMHGDAQLAQRALKTAQSRPCADLLAASAAALLAFLGGSQPPPTPEVPGTCRRLMAGKGTITSCLFLPAAAQRIRRLRIVRGGSGGADHAGGAAGATARRRRSPYAEGGGSRRVQRWRCERFGGVTRVGWKEV